MLVVNLVGNLGADVKRIEGVNFAPFYSLSVAHTEKFTKRDGTQVERTAWISCNINWDASRLVPYLIKGQKVAIVGRARLRSFKSADGTPAASLDVIVSEIELCGTNLAPARDDNERPEDPFNQTAVLAPF